MGFFQWVFGRHESRPPDAERSIEAAWLPLWQAQLVLHELWEREIPAVQSEDFTRIYDSALESRWHESL